MSKKRLRKKDRTNLASHKRNGKKLLPPFATLPNMHHSSWTANRLPEMLWAALLVSAFQRSDALQCFRDVGMFYQDHRDMHLLCDVSHTGLATMDAQHRDEILKIITGTQDRRAALRPLLLLASLPALENWKELLAPPVPEEDWTCLMTAIAKTLFHQSQEATDCRWLRVLCMVVGGKMHFPDNEMGNELVKEYLRYPDYGDQRKVRPSIRATEIMFEGEKSSWPNTFWQQCLHDTYCFPLPTHPFEVEVTKTTTADTIDAVYAQLAKHFMSTLSTTATDSKHDVVFGIAFFSLNLLKELLRLGISFSIAGRLSLRCLVDCAITLSYLSAMQKEDLWKSFRLFGAGQAKLQSLKIDEEANAPKYVNQEELDSLANEDIWEEFLPINLGHWQNSNLRDLSIKGNAKDLYDRYYAWTSCYCHGHWAALRDSSYLTCGNPLHRLHRIPGPMTKALPDVVEDTCALCDFILSVVEKEYPGFTARVTTEIRRT